MLYHLLFLRKEYGIYFMSWKISLKQKYFLLETKSYNTKKNNKNKGYSKLMLYMLFNKCIKCNICISYLNKIMSIYTQTERKYF